MNAADWAQLVVDICQSVAIIIIAYGFSRRMK